MAKYSIDGSTLTGIADAIRTQYGEESAIAVTDMAEAILGIEGGGGDLPSILYVGEFVPTSPSQSVTIEHGLGKVPYFYGVFAKQTVDAGYWWQSMAKFDDTLLNIGISAQSGSTGSKNTKGVTYSASETEFSFDVSSATYVSSICFKGTEYLTIAICKGE